MADTGRYDNCETGEDANEDVDCARVAVENSLYGYWSTTLPDQSNAGFEPEQAMATFTGVGLDRVRPATSAVGPFYCPPDQTIYLDTTFFEDVLEQQLGGPGGGFVEPYVLAHEYGHHIQNLLGTMGRVKTQQGPRSDAVRLELQADCYAGMWARAPTSTEDANGDVADRGPHRAGHPEALDAATAVGDDKIQQKTQGQVTEESWTHGSAASRVKWFQTGYQQGTLRGLRHLRCRRTLSADPTQPLTSASIWGNCRCSARRWGATRGCRNFPARAPSPAAARASAHSARLSTV